MRPIYLPKIISIPLSNRKLMLNDVRQLVTTHYSIQNPSISYLLDDRSDLFLVQDKDNHKLVLRVEDPNKPQYRNADGIQNMHQFHIQLEFMAHIGTWLESNGSLSNYDDIDGGNVSATYPIKSKSGDLSISFKSTSGDNHVAYMSTFAKGKIVTPKTEEFRSDHAHRFGEAIGLTQTTAQTNYSVPENSTQYSHETLIQNPVAFIKKLPPNKQPDAENMAFLDTVIDAVSSKIKTFESSEHCKRTMLHADHNTVNHHYTYCDTENSDSSVEDVVLFDFELLGYGPRVYDLAVALWTPRLDNDPGAKLFNAMMTGYEKHQPLSSEEKKMLGAYVIGRQLWHMRQIAESFKKEGEFGPFWAERFDCMKTLCERFQILEKP